MLRDAVSSRFALSVSEPVKKARSNVTCLYSVSIDELRVYMDPWVYKMCVVGGCMPTTH